MALHLALLLLYTNLIFGAWCQTIQDSWTAPATPNGSTSLQSGAPFTIRWKSELQYAFNTYCTSCDVKKLDFWVTSFMDQSYKFKIAGYVGSVDITSTTSFQWDVNIPSSALIANDYWVLRFTPVGAEDPFTEQISSSGFYISGPPEPSTIFNTVTARPSSTSSLTFESSTTPSNTSTIATPSSVTTDIPSAQDPDSSSKSWIAGAVVGPIVGIAIVGALLWVLFKRKRKNVSTEQVDADVEQDKYVYHPADSTYQDGEAKYAQTVVRPAPSTHVSEMAGDWQHSADGQNHSPAEMPGSASDRSPAELWQGNYQSRP